MVVYKLSRDIVNYDDSKINVCDWCILICPLSKYNGRLLLVK